MNTKFLTLPQLVKLSERMKEGDSKAIDYAIEEIQRLRQIIKDYELGARLLHNKVESSTYKTPEKLEL